MKTIVWVDATYQSKVKRRANSAFGMIVLTDNNMLNITKLFPSRTSSSAERTALISAIGMFPNATIYSDSKGNVDNIKKMFPTFDVQWKSRKDVMIASADKLAGRSWGTKTEIYQEFQLFDNY